MKLIDEIIEILSSENCNLENALIKTKILLHKMGEKELLEWINQELNGYDNVEDLPNYRKVKCIIVGSFQNYTTRYTNHPIPTMHLKDEILDYLTNINLSDSISTIEDLASGEDFIYISLDLEYAPLLSKALDPSLHIIDLKRQISKAKILGVLTQIRSRLLDFILDISEKIPKDISNKDIKSKSKEIGTKEIFNNAIFGNNTIINIGNNNNNKNIQIKDNFENLLQKLKDYKLDYKDLEDLKESIEKDKTIVKHERKEFGKNVKNWLAKISTKTRDKVVIEGIIEGLHKFYGWLV